MVESNTLIAPNMLDMLTHLAFSRFGLQGRLWVPIGDMANWEQIMRLKVFLRETVNLYEYSPGEVISFIYLFFWHNALIFQKIQYNDGTMGLHPSSFVVAAVICSSVSVV